jgi:hypothetical protein
MASRWPAVPFPGAMHSSVASELAQSHRRSELGITVHDHPGLPLSRESLSRLTASGEARTYSQTFTTSVGRSTRRFRVLHRNARSHAARLGHRCPSVPETKHLSAADGAGELHR